MPKITAGDAQLLRAEVFLEIILAKINNEAETNSTIPDADFSFKRMDGYKFRYDVRFQTTSFINSANILITEKFTKEFKEIRKTYRTTLLRFNEDDLNIVIFNLKKLIKTSKKNLDDNHKNIEIDFDLSEKKLEDKYKNIEIDFSGFQSLTLEEVIGEWLEKEWQPKYFTSRYHNKGSISQISKESRKELLNKLEQGWGKIYILGTEAFSVIDGYIEPRFCSNSNQEYLSPRACKEKDEFSFESFMSEIKKHNSKSLVYAEEGYGKTTLCQYLTMKLNSEDEYRNLNIIAIPVSLKRYSQMSASSLRSHISENVFSDSNRYELMRSIKNGQGFFLLDGLEVGNSEQVVRVVLEVKNLIDEFPKNRYLITSRNPNFKEYGLNNFEAFYTLLGFEGAERINFIKNWHKHKLKDKKVHEEVIEKAKMFSGSPLHLSMLCLESYNKNTDSEPNNVLQLCQDAMMTLLAWDNQNSNAYQIHDKNQERIYKVMDIIQREELLGFISLRLIKDGITKDDIKDMRFVSWEMLQDWIAQWLSDYWIPKKSRDHWLNSAAQMIQDIESQCGIIVDRGYLGYSFTHTALRDYFAARAISKNYRDVKILEDAISMIKHTEKQ